MRIGLSTSVVQRGKTGIAQYVFALLRAFLPRARDHEFVLFTLVEDLPLFEFARGEMEIVAVPEEFRPPVKNIFWHQTALPRLARAQHLDVLHVPSYRRLVWSNCCPRVGTIHDLAPFRVANKYDWKRMFYGRVIARELARRQDRIIAISANTAADLERFFHFGKDRVTVIHNGLDHDRFFPARSPEARTETARRYGLDRPFLLYVARLEHPAKNHVRLISAFNQFKAQTRSDWQLVLGGADWHGAEVIHRAIRESRFASEIRSLGFVSDAALPDLYRAADAFVYPSLYEGFGMPPTEAMACGCPVIASARGSLAEVLGEAAVIVDPENIHNMAQQLSAVAGDATLREWLQKSGLSQARKFDWRKTAEETLNLYEGAMNNGARISRRRSAQSDGCVPFGESAADAARRAQPVTVPSDGRGCPQRG